MELDRVRASVTSRLTSIFESVLKQSPIRSDESFFDLGGDSMLAISLLIEIEKAFDRELPMSALYDAPTVAGIAAVLEQRTVAQFSPLVLLKPGNHPAPLFIIHGIGGNIMELLQLGPLIRTGRPVYGVQAQGIDGSAPPNERVEDMAAYYLVAIRAVQPHGPYLLAGYSFGGLVALEIARRLRDSGQEIALLALIDGYPHPRYWPLRARLDVFGRMARRRAVRIARLPLREAGPAIRRQFADSLRYLRPNRYPDHDRSRPPEILPALQRVRSAGFAAWPLYSLPAYDGEILFIRAATSRRYPADPALVFPGKHLTILSIPGTHDQIVRAEVAGLAAQLSECLGQAVAAPGIAGRRGDAAEGRRPASGNAIPHPFRIWLHAIRSLGSPRIAEK